MNTRPPSPHPDPHMLQCQHAKFNKEIYLSAQFQCLTFAPGRVAQLVTCLATDASLTEDPGIASSIPARPHTFVEIDHEIISTVILLPSADPLPMYMSGVIKGCCQLQAKVCARSAG